MGNGPKIVRRNLVPVVLLAILLSLAATTTLNAQRLSSLSDQGTQRLGPVIAAPLDCPIDGYEPNDDFFAAYAISPDISYYGIYICPSGDEDWFKFSVTSGEQI
ncbi:MAG: hypothetical protein PVI07_09480, partial [Anaerolineae bacterium]